MNEKKLTVAGAKRRLREIENEILNLDIFLTQQSEKARFIVARANSIQVYNQRFGINFSFELGAE